MRADLPGTGRNLRDHPHLYTTWGPAFGYPMLPDSPRYQTALRYTSGTPPASDSPSGATAGPRNDMQILMISY